MSLSSRESSNSIGFVNYPLFDSLIVNFAVIKRVFASIEN